MLDLYRGADVLIHDCTYSPEDRVQRVVRTAVGSAHKSPFVRVKQGRSVKATLDRKVRYELDGGDRSKVTSVKVKVDPGAVTICVPRAA